MKKFVKRLVYSSPTGHTMVGGVTYDVDLTDANILGSVHEVGKTIWIGNDLWLVKGPQFLYKITVEKFQLPRKRHFRC